MQVVLDTNILVSALWSKDGSPANIVRRMLKNSFTLCYDNRILNEYEVVLNRPKFKFSKSDINALLEFVKTKGVEVLPSETDVSFSDEADKKFYEVAKHCNAFLVTGNLKHFPNDKNVLGVSDFLKVLETAL